jgi:hypothetical protein
VATPPAAKGPRRKGLIIFGLVVLVAGFLGGGALVAKSTSNYEDSVKSLARAPVGCTTTLVFDKLGTFTVYVETKGKVSDLSGDCEGNGASYEHSGDRLPRVTLSLVDANGDEVDLKRGASGTYDAAGFKGSAIRTVTIEDAGTYRLDVESADTDFAVALGKDPKKDSDLLKTVGGAVALGGLVVGLLLFLVGLRRRPALPASAAPMWTPSPYGSSTSSPERHPGYRVEPPPIVAPPGPPPMRLPDAPPSGGFAPPSVAPPPPAAPPPSTGWAPPDDDD